MRTKSKENQGPTHTETKFVFAANFASIGEEGEVGGNITNRKQQESQKGGDRYIIQRWSGSQLKVKSQKGNLQLLRTRKVRV